MKPNRLWSAAWIRMCGVLAIVAACALPAGAQSVTSAEVQRLQDQVYQASGELSRLRGTNPDAASRLQSDLDDLRDEVVYLKVKLRREGNINRSDYTDVRDRLQDLRSRATADTRTDNPAWTTNSSRTGAGAGSGNPNGAVTGGVSTGQSGETRDRSSQSARTGTIDDRGSDQGTRSNPSSDDRTRSGQGTNTRSGSSSDDRNRSSQGTTTRSGSNNSVIPSGQEIDVRLGSELSSATAQVEQRFEATTVPGQQRADTRGVNGSRRRERRHQDHPDGAEGQPDRRVRSVDSQRP
jgi:hypothetical protein